MINTIIFDIGGVLIDNPSEKLFSHCSKKLNISKEQFKKNWKDLESKFSEGMSEKDFWKEFSKKTKIRKPAYSLWEEAFKKVYNPKKEMFKLAKNLKKRYKIAVLSNIEFPALRIFRKKSPDFFHKRIFSCIEKTRKPEKKIYKIALKKLNSKPKETVFIDNKRENVIAAKSLGIKAILFKTEKQVKKELTQLLK